MADESLKGKKVLLTYQQAKLADARLQMSDAREPFRQLGCRAVQLGSCVSARVEVLEVDEIWKPDKVKEAKAGPRGLNSSLGTYLLPSCDSTVRGPLCDTGFATKPLPVESHKQASYGTTSTEHPSVAELFSDLGKFYAGGAPSSQDSSLQFMRNSCIATSDRMVSCLCSAARGHTCASNPVSLVVNRTPMRLQCQT